MSPSTSNAPPKRSAELSNAIYDDWKRKVVDEAKKRAVGQNVDYDTFKNMVSVAHLRPIGAANTRAQDMMLPSWRFTADGTAPSTDQQAMLASAAALMSKEPTEAPSTSGDFNREWRRNCPTSDAKYRYLRLVGPAAMGELFKVEIGVDVLKEVLSVLESEWVRYAGAAQEAAGEDAESRAALSEATFVLATLGGLSHAGRFSLTARMMGGSGIAMIVSLFSQLEGAVAAAAAVHEAEIAGELLPPPQAASPDYAGLPIGVARPEQFAALKTAFGLKQA